MDPALAPRAPSGAVPDAPSGDKKTIEYILLIVLAVILALLLTEWLGRKGKAGGAPPVEFGGAAGDGYTDLIEFRIKGTTDQGLEVKNKDGRAVISVTNKYRDGDVPGDSLFYTVGNLPGKPDDDWYVVSASYEDKANDLGLSSATIKANPDGAVHKIKAVVDDNKNLVIQMVATPELADLYFKKPEAPFWADAVVPKGGTDFDPAGADPAGADPVGADPVGAATKTFTDAMNVLMDQLNLLPRVKTDFETLKVSIIDISRGPPSEENLNNASEQLASLTGTANKFENIISYVETKQKAAATNAKDGNVPRATIKELNLQIMKRLTEGKETFNGLNQYLLEAETAVKRFTASVVAAKEKEEADAKAKEAAALEAADTKAKEDAAKEDAEKAAVAKEAAAVALAKEDAEKAAVAKEAAATKAKEEAATKAKEDAAKAVADAEDAKANDVIAAAIEKVKSREARIAHLLTLANRDAAADSSTAIDVDTMKRSLLDINKYVDTVVECIDDMKVAKQQATEALDTITGDKTAATEAIAEIKTAIDTGAANKALIDGIYQSVLVIIDGAAPPPGSPTGSPALVPGTVKITKAPYGKKTAASFGLDITNQNSAGVSGGITSFNPASPAGNARRSFNYQSFIVNIAGKKKDVQMKPIGDNRSLAQNFLDNTTTKQITISFFNDRNDAIKYIAAAATKTPPAPPGPHAATADYALAASNAASKAKAAALAATTAANSAEKAAVNAQTGATEAATELANAITAANAATQEQNNAGVAFNESKRALDDSLKSMKDAPPQPSEETAANKNVSEAEASVTEAKKHFIIVFSEVKRAENAAKCAGFVLNVLKAVGTTKDATTAAADAAAEANKKRIETQNAIDSDAAKTASADSVAAASEAVAANAATAAGAAKATDVKNDATANNTAALNTAESAKSDPKTLKEVKASAWRTKNLASKTLDFVTAKEEAAIKLSKKAAASAAAAGESAEASKRFAKSAVESKAYNEEAEEANETEPDLAQPIIPASFATQMTADEHDDNINSIGPIIIVTGSEEEGLKEARKFPGRQRALLITSGLSSEERIALQLKAAERLGAKADISETDKKFDLTGARVGKKVSATLVKLGDGAVPIGQGVIISVGN